VIKAWISRTIPPPRQIHDLINITGDSTSVDQQHSDHPLNGALATAFTTLIKYSGNLVGSLRISP